jgi:hypothetical protein
MIDVLTRPFEHQVDALVSLVGSDDRAALRAAVATACVEPEPERSVLTPARSLVPLARSAARVTRDGRALVLGHLTFDDLETFEPIASVRVPAAAAYVAVDIDLGAGSRNVRPEDALRDILAAGRSPLTIDEGVALLLQQPTAIQPNWGFSMAGSRRADQRVPAFWVSEGRPKLGWCWDRNPHTWLGTASCAGRIAGVS